MLFGCSGGTSDPADLVPPIEFRIRTQSVPIPYEAGLMITENWRELGNDNLPLVGSGPFIFDYWRPNADTPSVWFPKATVSGITRTWNTWILIWTVPG